MKNRYKIPWHIRQFVKKELLDYEANKRLVSEYKGDSRRILIVNTRIAQIERVFERLSKEEREEAELIFICKYTQSGAEIARGISKDAYYNIMNKVIYLVAVEMNLL